MAIKSVAVIGAGAAGAITTASLVSEKYFDRIRVFERRSCPGGTWIYDANPGDPQDIPSGQLPPQIDQPLTIPTTLPTTKTPSREERWTATPIYESLTTNVPDIAMSFSDSPFPYGPFVPHHVARQYIESYFASHNCDHLLELNTTLEDLKAIPDTRPDRDKRRTKWQLTLRRYDAVRQVDVWWEEVFDAVVLANGHYSVPFVPFVPGLKEYGQIRHRTIMHSKYYRSPLPFKDKRVVVIGNSASGHDISAECVGIVKFPVYVSRRSRSRWDGDQPPEGIAWKPVIKEYKPDGRILFDDGTWLDGVDVVIYCTGYKASFPFWNYKANGGQLWDYERNKLHGCYWHTFLRDFPTIAVVGIPRTLTFRSFEYQAIAIARLWSERNSLSLPSPEEQLAWEQDRMERCRREHKNFHDIPWDDGETQGYLTFLFEFAGLGTFQGEGRLPPPLGPDIVWAIEHVKKYPEPPRSARKVSSHSRNDWEMIEGSDLDSLGYL